MESIDCTHGNAVESEVSLPSNHIFVNTIQLKIGLLLFAFGIKAMPFLMDLSTLLSVFFFLIAFILIAIVLISPSRKKMSLLNENY